MTVAIVIVCVLLLLLFNPFSIYALAYVITHRNDDKYLYGWTKVMKDGNGRYRICTWEKEVGAIEDDFSCSWLATSYVYDTFDEAKRMSDTMNASIIYKKKALQLIDIDMGK